MAFTKVSNNLEDAHWEYIKALVPDQGWKIKYLHDRLTIIDTKASALLRVNSTIMGFLGAIVALIPRLPAGEHFPPHPTIVLSAIIVILTVLAICDILSLYIFRLHFYRGTTTTTDPVASLDEYHKDLEPLTTQREQIVSWLILLSSVGELGFAALFIILTLSELGLR